ncbi:hypothetical protein EBU99_06095 [bacterium]|nr:hypothetical protein [bacterium]
MTSQVRMAAVAYLNMLPFFAKNSAIELFSSPQILNTIATQFDAYCSSLIAGLNAEKKPLTSSFGVFSSGPVMSVFVEPVLHNDNHLKFWQQLSEFWSLRQPDPVHALRQADAHGTILLRTAGDSAQSVWMFQILCALAGFKVEISNDDVAQNNAKPLPEACLWIGDAAIARRISEPSALRLDLGDIWNSHTGHRAWFAGWFAGSSQTQVSHLALEETLTQMLQHSVESWKCASDFARWCASFAFLESQKSPLASASAQDDCHNDLREILTDYFNCLEHRISAEEGEQLLSFYSALKAEFVLWMQNEKAEGPTIELPLPCGSTPCSESHLLST